jgi:hypothetical protein
MAMRVLKEEAQEIKDTAQDLVNHSADYAETFYELTKIKLTRKVADTSSSAIVAILSFIVSIFILLFASIAAAWWLGDLIENRTGGFLLVAGFYLLLLLILLAMNKNVISPYIKNSMIKKMYEEKD